MENNNTVNNTVNTDENNVKNKEPKKRILRKSYSLNFRRKKRSNSYPTIIDDKPREIIIKPADDLITDYEYRKIIAEFDIELRYQKTNIMSMMAILNSQQKQIYLQQDQINRLLSSK